MPQKKGEKYPKMKSCKDKAFSNPKVAQNKNKIKLVTVMTTAERTLPTKTSTMLELPG